MRTFLGGVSAAVLMMAAAPAMAQDEQGAPPTTPPTPAEIAPAATDQAEIIVTARKIYQPNVTSFGDLGTTRVLDTPFSVNTISSGLIDVRQAVNIIDLQKIDPSIQVNFRGYANFVSLRGFKASGLNSRFEGVPTTTNAAIPLEIMDRIDVLRGPSGFLYG